MLVGYDTTGCGRIFLIFSREIIINFYVTFVITVNHAILHEFLINKIKYA